MFAPLFAFILLMLSAAVQAASTSTVETPALGSVYEMSVAGPIDSAVARYLKDGLEKADRDRAQMVVITLDTPGGLLDATRDIVQSILNTPVPVVVYVSPRGARATSAGVFLMMAADVAAMSPETHLGAAHPVAVGVSGSTGSSVMEAKASSDAAAFIRALAQEKGRNAAWAEMAVRESVSLTADEAYQQQVVDVVAEDETDLFAQIEGGQVDKNGWTYDLTPVLAPRTTLAMSPTMKFLHVLANPNLSYLLLLIGVYALLYEFVSPGIGWGGVTGVVCLVLVYFSLQVLPLNAAGLAILITGLILMSMDHAVGGHGLLMTGGAVAFGAGSFLLYDRADPSLRISLSLIVGCLAAAVGFSLIVLKSAWGTRRIKPAVGREALVGKTAETREGGQVFVEGQLWTAEGYGPFRPGEKVSIVGVEGNKLIIEKL